MLQPRYEPRGSSLDGVWLVSGGADTLTTDVWDGLDSSFDAGPDLPSAMIHPCQLTVNSTHVFFADSVDETAYLLDWERQAWTTLDTLYMTHRFSAACGMISNPENGTEVS